MANHASARTTRLYDRRRDEGRLCADSGHSREPNEPAGLDPKQPVRTVADA
jgi:hypothetical protein